MGAVVILGAGGHAKVVIELIEAGGGAVAALLDHEPHPRQVLGAQVVGDDAALPALFAEGLREAFIAIGDNTRRLAARERLSEAGFSLVNAISPRAAVSPSATLGVGVAVMPGAMINACAEIADLAIVNTGAVIDHDTRLGLACHVGPGAVLAGGVVVGERALIGAGASIIPGRRVGAGAIVGAGACVIHDVGEGATVAGAPARVLRT